MGYDERNTEIFVSKWHEINHRDGRLFAKCAPVEQHQQQHVRETPV